MSTNKGNDGKKADGKGILDHVSDAILQDPTGASQCLDVAQKAFKTESKSQYLAINQSRTGFAKLEGEAYISGGDAKNADALSRALHLELNALKKQAFVTSDDNVQQKLEQFCALFLDTHFYGYLSYMWTPQYIFSGQIENLDVYQNAFSLLAFTRGSGVVTLCSCGFRDLPSKPGKYRFKVAFCDVAVQCANDFHIISHHKKSFFSEKSSQEIVEVAHHATAADIQAAVAACLLPIASLMELQFQAQNDPLMFNSATLQAIVDKHDKQTRAGLQGVNKAISA